MRIARAATDAGTTAGTGTGAGTAGLMPGTMEGVAMADQDADVAEPAAQPAAQPVAHPATDSAAQPAAEAAPHPAPAHPAPAHPAPTHDVDWFTAVVEEHSTALVRYFARRGPRQDAEDLAGEVFATAWRRREDVPDTAVLPWLYRTAGFTLANHRRKAVDLPVGEVPEAGSTRVDGDPELSALFDAELRGALASVGERDRRILLLHAWEGLDGAELAAALGVSRSGADAALSRARKRLREAWGERATF